jgi:uncharacterized protein DUF3325
VSELAAICLAWVGMSCFCVAMTRHHRAVFGGTPARRTRLLLRVTGTMLLALSLAAAVSGAGWAFGSVQWGCAISVSALAMVLLVSYRPRWLLRATAAILLAGGLLLAV